MSLQWHFAKDGVIEINDETGRPVADVWSRGCSRAEQEIYAEDFCAAQRMRAALLRLEAIVEASDAYQIDTDGAMDTIRWGLLAQEPRNRELRAAVGLPVRQKQSQDEWECPINHEGCARNCGNYGCGN